MIASTYFGPGTKAVLQGNTLTGNTYGADIGYGSGDTTVALLEGNNLVANTGAGLQVEGGATVDAGDCTGSNVTGLGSSTGGNDFSGYFVGTAKAIINLNSGSPSVLAYQDNYGAVSGQNILNVLSGAVAFSQSGGLLLTSPPIVSGPSAPQCLNDVAAVAPAAANLAQFLAQGGIASASSVSSFSSSQTFVLNSPGNYTVTRTYSLTDTAASPRPATRPFR